MNEENGRQEQEDEADLPARKSLAGEEAVAKQDRGPDFLRLANVLSALYPQGCNEKRLLDAMLLAVPR